MDGRFTAGIEEPMAARPLFATDAGSAAGAAGREAGASLLAELTLHNEVETPFCIGLFGGPGAGKTCMLEEVVTAAEQLAAAAAEAGLATPFVADLLVVRVDGAGEGAPAALLGGAVFDRLAGVSPALAAELRHAGADPAEAARAASQALDDARSRLDAGRQALEALSGRDARLAEIVLDTPGSLVDGYARAKRGRLETILGRFGFDVTDPVATYKELVRHAAEGAAGGLSQVGFALRALVAYKGQTRLILGAVVVLALGWGCSLVRGERTNGIESLRGTGEGAAPAADWMQAHLSWLAPIETLLLLLAALLLLINLGRAARFVLPISRGVDLLQQDLEGRRRELSGLMAHATRRVDALAAEVELASRATAEAERRIGRGGQSSAGVPRPEGLAPASSAPAAFFRALATAMAGSPAGAPRRILVAIDGLDGRAPAAAAAMLAAVRALFGPGIVTVAAISPHHLAAGFSETDPASAAAELSRCIQVPYRVGVAMAGEGARRAYALSLIDGAGPADEPAVSNARQSLLERPWLGREAATLAALAPFAGETPRAIKRFVNLYRIARADPRLQEAPRPVFTALALALALDAHGFPDDLTALEQASQGEAPGHSTLLRQALAAAREASGEPVELGQAQHALDVAATYSSRA